MNTILNRMYNLSLPYLQKAEHNKGLNSHHMAQRMSYLAAAAALSDQNYRAFLLFFERYNAMDQMQLAAEMKVSRGHANMILRKLRALNLIDKVSGTKPYAYTLNSFLRKP